MTSIMAESLDNTIIGYEESVIETEDAVAQLDLGSATLSVVKNEIGFSVVIQTSSGHACNIPSDFFKVLC